MASHQVIQAACEALSRQLADAAGPAGLGRARFGVRLPGGSEPPGRPGRNVSVVPYQVEVDRSVRPPGRGGDGPAPLPVEVRLLVVVSGSDPGSVLALTGWVMRTLHDHPVLQPPDPAEPGQDPAWGEDERVHVTAEDLDRTELLELCATLGVTARGGLALPYVLSGLTIDA